jgi:hypothetical protein
MFQTKNISVLSSISSGSYRCFRDMITALTEDSKNDAKGSAGDKHETHFQ